MSEPYLGQIELFAFSFPPREWAFCNGALQGIVQNQALFAIFSNNYGGDGRTSFGLPNLTSRASVGFNMGNNYGQQAFVIGTKRGGQYQSLHTAHLPTHQHQTSFNARGGVPEVDVAVTQDQGTTATLTHGDYLASPADLPGTDAPEKIFKTSPSSGSLVSLGGVHGGGQGDGTVNIQNAGNNDSLVLLNPCTAVNFSVALAGVFPPRN
ncbi:tail Collar domain-containing protein [Thalassotalea insulae]|uniref:Tail Collar domain-containing protein n=1 Tax=Thalassotalea insulae TaxID=2056778 RepID=A0ABQ6GWC1_9GAMM|nr:tail fiber protein [Thalassotalea insulae]GLX80157.1 tail Collar domain-containing protein [Thalassotalea insulae]